MPATIEPNAKTRGGRLRQQRQGLYAACEVSKLLGINHNTFAWHLRAGNLPEPQTRMAGANDSSRAYYTASDIEDIRRLWFGK